MTRQLVRGAARWVEIAVIPVLWLIPADAMAQRTLQGEEEEEDISRSLPPGHTRISRSLPPGHTRISRSLPPGHTRISRSLPPGHTRCLPPLLAASPNWPNWRNGWGNGWPNWHNWHNWRNWGIH